MRLDEELLPRLKAQTGIEEVSLKLTREGPPYADVIFQDLRVTRLNLETLFSGEGLDEPIPLPPYFHSESLTLQERASLLNQLTHNPGSRLAFDEFTITLAERADLEKLRITNISMPTQPGIQDLLHSIHVTYGKKVFTLDDDKIEMASGFIARAGLKHV